MSIEKSIVMNEKDELQAQKDYKKFGKELRKAGLKSEARVVRNIQKQEHEHYNKLHRIHKKVEKLEYK